MVYYAPECTPPTHSLHAAPPLPGRDRSRSRYTREHLCPPVALLTMAPLTSGPDRRLPGMYRTIVGSSSTFSLRASQRYQPRAVHRSSAVKASRPAKGGGTTERMGPNWTLLLVRIDQPWTKSASLPGGTRPDTPHHQMQTRLCKPRISWAVCTNGAVAGRRIGLRTGGRSVLNAPGARS